MEIETPSTEVAKEQPKPIVLVQQSGREEKLEPVPLIIIKQEPSVPAPVKTAEQPPSITKKEQLDEEDEEEIVEKPPQIASPVRTESKPAAEEKKPLRVIEIKGIQEKQEPEDDEEDDLNINELWFEQAVQEE